MGNPLELTTREIKEIHHALIYQLRWAHGTVGHNMLIIIAKMAYDRGFRIDSSLELEIPEGVVVTDK